VRHVAHLARFGYTRPRADFNLLGVSAL